MNSSKSFAQVIDSTDGYGKGQGESNLVDIYDLASKVMEKFPDSSLIVDRVHKMLTNTVVNTTNGESKSNASGLSIYLPKEYGSHLSQSVVNSMDGWQQIVTKQYYFSQLDKLNPAVNSQILGKNIIGWVDPDDVANVTLTIGTRSPTRMDMYTEELEPSKIINRNGYFRYFWDREMISLCNEQSCYPTRMTFDSEGDNKIVQFPVVILSTTNSYATVGLSLIYEINENEGRTTFLGAIPEINTEGD